jgi:hypothetical protein
MCGSTERIISVYSRRLEDVHDAYKKISTNYKLYPDITVEMNVWPHIPAWFTAVKPAVLHMIQLDLRVAIHQYIGFVMYFSILTRHILIKI